MFVHTLQMFCQKSRTTKAVLYGREIGQYLLRNMAKSRAVNRLLSYDSATKDEVAQIIEQQGLNMGRRMDPRT
jgi:hypothetical protein